MCYVLIAPLYSLHHFSSLFFTAWKILFRCNALVEFDLIGNSLQARYATANPAHGAGLQSTASTDSIMDYGQYAILSRGNVLCSAATAQSTMDFSTKPIQHGVVDSPPNGGTRPVPKSSPSPLRSREPSTSRRSRSPSDRVPQRKLYEDALHPINSLEVRILSFPAPLFRLDGLALMYT